MRYIFILLIFSGCAAKKKTVDIAKQQHEQTEHTEERHSSDAAISSTAESNGITAYDFSQLVGKWSLDYDGEAGDGFRFYLNQTENGWEAGAEGKGKATASREETNLQTRHEVSWQERFDSLSKISETNFEEYENRIKSLEKNKSIDKKTIGMPAGVYITAAFFCCIMVLLWLFKKRLKRF